MLAFEVLVVNTDHQLYRGKDPETVLAAHEAFKKIKYLVICHKARKSFVLFVALVDGVMAKEYTAATQRLVELPSQKWGHHYYEHLNPPQHTLSSLSLPTLSTYHNPNIAVHIRTRSILSEPQNRQHLRTDLLILLQYLQKQIPYGPTLPKQTPPLHTTHTISISPPQQCIISTACCKTRCIGLLMLSFSAYVLSLSLIHEFM